MLEKQLTERLKKQVDEMKSGKGKTISLETLKKDLIKSHKKRIRKTTPAQRIIDKIESEIEELKKDIGCIKSFSKLLATTDTIKISEFLTGELDVCSIHKTGKCNCHYGQDEEIKYHPNGKVSHYCDIGVYIPKLKDYQWTFVFNTKKDSEELKKEEEKFEKMDRWTEDPLVDDIYNHKDDEIFFMEIDKEFITKDDIVAAVKKFIKDYFRVNKKVVWEKSK